MPGRWLLKPARDEHIRRGVRHDGGRGHERDQAKEREGVRHSSVENQQAVDDGGKPLRAKPGGGEPFPAVESPPGQQDQQRQGPNRDEREQGKDVAADGDRAEQSPATSTRRRRAARRA